MQPSSVTGFQAQFNHMFAVFAYQKNKKKLEKNYRYRRCVVLQVGTNPAPRLGKKRGKKNPPKHQRFELHRSRRGAAQCGTRQGVKAR